MKAVNLTTGELVTAVEMAGRFRFGGHVLESGVIVCGAERTVLHPVIFYEEFSLEPARIARAADGLARRRAS